MRSTLSGAMRPCSSALRLSETEADGASASGTSPASATRTFFSSNSNWPALAQARGRPPRCARCRPATSSRDRSLDVGGRGSPARPDRAAGAHRGGRPPARRAKAGDAGDLGQQRQGDRYAGAVRRTRVLRDVARARLGTCRSSAGAASGRLAPRFSSHRSLARMAIPVAGPATMQASNPPSSSPRAASATRLASAATSQAIAILRYRQLRISARASQGVPRPPARKRGGKSDQRKALRLRPARPPRRHAVRSVRSAAAARGRRCRARDAAGASCRLPERRDRPGPWSPRRRPLRTIFSPRIRPVAPPRR